jgi:hypothetical protein
VNKKRTFHCNHYKKTRSERRYEKEFVDRINEINFIIKEFQKLYDKAPATDNLFRAKVLKEIEHTKRILSKVQIEYEMFKKYKKTAAAIATGKLNDIYGGQVNRYVSE